MTASDEGGRTPGTERFVSFAQHGEDVILWRALGHRQDVRYVDVGAFHPRDDSVTHALYQRGWRGVNIEAQPDRLQAFLDERPEDTNLGIAIGDEDGTATLAVPPISGWASLLSAEDIGVDESEFVHVEVPVRRLDTLLPELGLTHVDVLKIDVEGAEPAVVRGLLAGDVRPSVVVVEGAAPGLGRVPGDAAVALLVEAGYTHCMFDGLNHYLTTDPALVPDLSVPANPLDDFVLQRVDRLLQERASLTQAIATLASDNEWMRQSLAGSAPPETSAQPDLDPAAAGPDLETDVTASPEAPASDLEGDLRTVPGEAPSDQEGDLPALSDVAATTAPAHGWGGVTGAGLTLVGIEPGVRKTRRRRSLIRLLRTLHAAPAAAPATPEAPTLSLLELSRGPVEPSDAVLVLYREVLGRPADASGLAAWTARAESGRDLLALAQEMAASQEALNRPHHERVAVRDALGAWAMSRAAGQAGVGSWFAQGDLDSDPRDQIFVLALFEVALGRLPDLAELRHEVSKLADGTGREWLLRNFASRPEAISRLVGPRRPGVRGTVRAVRDRRGHLATFRRLVEAAEGRQLAVLLEASARAHVAGTPPFPSPEGS